MNRRELLKLAALAGAATVLGCGKKGDTEGSTTSAVQPSSAPAKPAGKPTVAVAKGDDAAALVAAVLRAVGGMGAFVKSGSTVVIKPNAGWQRTPEQAANTNPAVLEAVIRQCQKAGAKRIIVAEHTCDTPATVCFEMSGIGEVIDRTGVELVAANDEGQYVPLDIAGAKTLRKATVIREIQEADCFINVPVAKHHSGAGLSIGLKNLMGAVWDRGQWHSDGLGQCIADYALAVRPHLTVIDATTIMVTGGPKGPGETKKPNEVICSSDPVAADVYAATLFGLKAQDLDYLLRAAEHGLGELDSGKVDLKRVG